MALAIPPNLTAAADTEDRRAWIDALPATVHGLAERWSLDLGVPFEPGGQTAWVAPAQRSGDALVLKVAWRHDEAAHEADGLRAWDGNGAVRLHDAAEVDEQTAALLIERCAPGTTLAGRPEPEQDVVIAGLLRRLWIEPASGHPFRPLQEMCDAWADSYEHDPVERGALDPGLAREGIALLRALPATADRTVLLCTDLHAGNVLAAEREPWLVIDPKPYVGDPTYDALQHILNCGERLRTDPRALVSRLADLLDLDRDRLLLWLFARSVAESPHWPGLADIAHRIAPH